MVGQRADDVDQYNGLPSRKSIQLIGIHPIRYSKKWFEIVKPFYRSPQIGHPSNVEACDKLRRALNSYRWKNHKWYSRQPQTENGVPYKSNSF